MNRLSVISVAVFPKGKTVSSFHAMFCVFAAQNFEQQREKQNPQFEKPQIFQIFTPLL